MSRGRGVNVPQGSHRGCTVTKGVRDVSTAPLLHSGGKMESEGANSRFQGQFQVRTPGHGASLRSNKEIMRNTLEASGRSS